MNRSHRRVVARALLAGAAIASLPAIALFAYTAPATQPTTAPAADFPAALPSFVEPSISPDGKEVAFVHAGDIWTVPSDGGEARLLISHPANETRPLYSPDGKSLAFVSTRGGNADVYVLTLATGDVARLTYDDASTALDAWSRDGKYLYFSSNGNDLGSINNDVYRVPAAGGTPMAVVGDRYSNEFMAAPSPDGKSLAFCAGGAGSRDWWRRGHSHWDECQVWLMTEGLDGAGTPKFESLTQPGAKDLWPLWSGGGSTLFYVSDKGGAQNLWARKRDGGAERRVTKFKDGRVSWPAISTDGNTIVFERDFALWRVNARDENAEPVELKITPRGAAAVATPDTATFGGNFRELALSPDGKKIAFVVRGEVFAVSAKDGGRAVRVTQTAAAESNLTWARDSRRLAYVSERDGPQHVFLYDFAENRETQLTKGDGEDSTPRFSPDGKRIAFRRDGETLRVLDLESKAETQVAGDLDNGLPPFDDALSPLVWSPKGEWLAYIASGAKGFDNVMIVPSAGERPPTPVTFFANSGSNAVSWTPDGRSILFGTGQRTEDYQLAKVDLTLRPPTFPEDQFRGLFPDEEKLTRPGPPRDVRPPADRPAPAPSPATQPGSPSDLLTSTTQPSTNPTTGPSTAPTTAPAAPSTTGPATTSAAKPEPQEKLSLRGVRQRTTLLPLGADVDYQTVSPDGKTVVVIATTSGKQNLYSYPLDIAGGEPAVLRQLTTTTGSKSHPCFTPDGRDVYFLDGGQIRVVGIESRSTREVSVTAEMRIDFNADKREVARQAWKYLKLNFYDPKLHGVDWQAARERYFPHVAGARTPEELRRVLLLMVGELNASHLGISSRGGSAGVVGRLGLRFDRAELEKSGKFRVAEVVPQSPAAVAEIKVGQFLLAIDDEPLTASSNIDAMLSHKTGRKVTLDRSETADGELLPELAVRPVDAATERSLAYRAWVEAQRRYVERASKGRLGYVHLADMSQAALSRLTLDLDARAYGRDGVVIDIRGNLGGFVSPYALDVFARRGYLTVSRRGAGDSPARTYVGQRALESPTILVTNRQSVSDAENFTEGYRALGLGKVVGEPTAGGVIFTSDTTLLDGSTLRIPYSKVTANRDGGNLESNPRSVDVVATRQLGESGEGKDGQLDAAVRTLVDQIAGKGKSETATTK